MPDRPVRPDVRRADVPPPVPPEPRPDPLCALALEHRQLAATGRWLAAQGTEGPPVAETTRYLVAVTLHEVHERVLVDRWIREHLGRPDLADLRASEEWRLLRDLDDLRDVGDVPPPRLLALHERFIEHSDREEIETFPLLRHVLSAQDLTTGWHRLALLREQVASRCSSQHQGPDAWRSHTALAIAEQLTTHLGGPTVTVHGPDGSPLTLTEGGHERLVTPAARPGARSAARFPGDARRTNR